MTLFELKLKEVDAYQKQINSKKTYLYEIYNSDYVGDSFTTVLADTDAEAKHIASIIAPNAKWMRVDHWGKGPRIDLK